MFIKMKSKETQEQFIINSSLIGIVRKNGEFSEVHTTNNLRFGVYESLDEIAEMLAEVEQ